MKKAGPKRKKGITKTQTTQVPNTANDTIAGTAAELTIHPTARMMSVKRSNDWTVNLNEFLRCMDPDVLILFEEELLLKYPLPDDSIGKNLGLMEFKYVCTLFHCFLDFIPLKLVNAFSFQIFIDFYWMI